MTNKELAQSILAEVGGAENVKSLTHCMTRLRFELNDYSKVDDKSISSLKGVQGVMKVGNQYQIIIGTHVNKLYDEMNSLSGFGHKDETTKTGFDIKKFFGSILPFISACISPLFPALIGGGLLKVLVLILGPSLTNVLSETNHTYVILSALADTAFYFLPLGLAYTASKQLKVNMAMALAVVALLIHPNLIALFDSGNAAKFATQDGIKLFGFLPIVTGTYSSSFLPALFAVILLKYVDWVFDKIIPNIIKSFLKPPLVLIVAGVITLFALAPLGNIIGQWIMIALKWIYGYAPWLAIGIISGAMPFLVMSGMHWAFYAVTLILLADSATGNDPFTLPAMLLANLAQGSAALAYSFKLKDKSERSQAISAGVLALLAGITEPAMYGINLKYKKPIMVVSFVSFLGGIAYGILGVTAYAGATPALLSIAEFISPNGSWENITYTAIIAGIAIILTFVLTLIISSDKIQFSRKAMILNKIKVEKLTLYNPMNGKAIALKDVNDATFASEVLGKGYAIEPKEGILRAPFNGTVQVVMDSKHAIGLKSDDGMEVLMHIGLDTVKLNGKHFKSNLKVGDKVSLGDNLIKFDIKAIKKEGYELTTPIIITNAQEFDNINLSELGEHKFGDKMASVISEDKNE